MSLEFSESALEAMRGNFILAGESAPPSTAQELGHLAVPELPADFLDAAQLYLNPAANLGLEAQLHIAGGLMKVMNLQIPTENMSEQQVSKLEQHYNELPSNDYRLVAAPLFPSDSNLLRNRQNMLSAVRDSYYETNLRTDAEPLHVNIYAYRRLLQNPSGINYEAEFDSNTPLWLHYKSDWGPLTRGDYLTYLSQKGLVVAGTNDVQWTYNFVDVRAETPRLEPVEFAKAYKDICAITNSPEEEIAVCALHAITDSVSNQVMVNLTNEAIYAGDPSGSRLWVLDIVGLDWINSGEQLHLNPWAARNSSLGSGVRNSINGLAP